jgi:hypothetical protein
MRPWMIMFALIMFFMFCCHKKPHHQATDDKKGADCQPFFAFDHLDHYQIKIADDSISNLREKENLNDAESRLLDILQSDSSMTIADTATFIDLHALGYTKQPIGDADFDRINLLFCEGIFLEEMSINMCIPAFRDILVFQNDGRTVGFAKLCFDCDQRVIAGTDKDATQFGQTGEFKKLASILKVEKLDY